VEIAIGDIHYTVVGESLEDLEFTSLEENDCTVPGNLFE
jgi:hypothetical protein